MEGKWAGKPLVLEDWERKVIRDVFGTMRDDGYRQYREVYIEIPKKNGKTTLAAGLVCYLLTADGENGAQVYGAAADRNQASLVYRPAANMIRKCPGLKKRCKCVDSQKRIVYQKTNSFFQVLSAEVPQKHGLNLSGCVIDELHVQPTRDLFDVLTKYSGSAREQPLWWYITTAGTDRNSICWEIHEKARQILNGTREDDTFYAVIYGLEDDDDWTSEENWYKANPSLGSILKIEDFRRDFKEAQESPADENQFRQLRLNQWVTSSTRWMQLKNWDKCAGKLRDLEGQPCYGGLDLSSTEDLTAFSLVWPRSDYTFDVWTHFWIPEDAAKQHEKHHRVPYSKWIRQGLVTATPGPVIDYDWVIQAINDLMVIYDIKEIAFDRWGAAKIVNDLAKQCGFTLDPNIHGRKLIQFGQGYQSMSAPTKELYRLTMNEDIRHGGNPVLRWNIDNLVVTSDAAGNIKPDKQKSTMKIDGAVSTIMGLDRATKHIEKPKPQFVIV